MEGSKIVSYSYDLNGNRVERDEGGVKDTFSWDYENRLVSLSKQSTGGTGAYAWVYDYRTRRVELGFGGMTTKVSFSGGTSVREFENNIPSVDYVRGSDWGGGVGGILYTKRGGIPSFTHYNGRGDVTSKTSAAGVITYQSSYEGFGQRTAEVGSTQDRQKSNTKDEDIPGYMNEGFRFRDLETGSFISRDPAGFVDGPNLYAYVMQNPWTKFDPDGLRAETVKEKVELKKVDQKAQVYRNNAAEFNKKADSASNRFDREKFQDRAKRDGEKAGRLENSARHMRDIINRMTDNSADISNVISGKQTPWVMKVLREIGTKELDNGWNPRIKEYQNTTVPGFFKDDGGGQNAWCAAFVNWNMQQTDTKGMEGYEAMRAKDWVKWGQKHDGPGFGAVGVMRGE